MGEMSRAFWRAAVLGALLGAGCGDRPTEPAGSTRVDLVRVVPFGAWLQPGDTLRLEALPFDSAGLPVLRPVHTTWRSGQPAVADVDSTGRATAVSVGDASIVAAIEGVEGSAVLHVLPDPGAFAIFDRLTAGDDFTCGVDPLGVVACWGLNAHGQLGNEGVADGPVPVAAPGPAGVTALDAGTRHACAIDGDGRPWCWGWNSVHQVWPDIADKIVLAPRPLPLEGRFTELAAGSGHSCALREDGIVNCWGAGGLGQLGDGSPKPVGSTHVSGVPAIVAIVAGHAHSCGLDAGGGVWCWGWNASGQLGAASGTCAESIPCSAHPLPVPVGIRFRSLAAGSGFNCALDAPGTAWCWGANAAGQLGTGPGPASPEPVPVPGTASLVAIAAGAEHACGLNAGGTVLCWGDNRYGQLGDGTTGARSGPVVAHVAPSPAARLAAGAWHTCAIGQGGRVTCWGANAAGQLGLNPASD